MEIQINKEYMELLPPLEEEEFEALKWSIMTEGQHYPIVVNQDGIILDGHQRYGACQELGRECEYVVKEFESPLLEKKFVIETNLQRRQLTDYQKFELYKVLDEINRQLGRERLSEAGKLGRDIQLGLASGEATLPLIEDAGKSAEQTAKAIGVSKTSVERMRKIDKKGTEEQKEALRKGETGVRTEYEKIRGQEKKEEAEQETKKLFVELTGSEKIAEEAVQEMKGQKYLEKIEGVASEIMTWGIPLMMAMGEKHWSSAISIFEAISKRTAWLASLDPSKARNAVEAEFEIVEE